MSREKPTLSARSVEALQDSPAVELPPDHLLDLPETVLQFGTGRFLRGFADYIVDRGNRDGHYAGRILAVQSTGQRRTDLLNRQDCLFTVCEQGMHDGSPEERYEVVSSISRVVSASEQWAEVIKAASSESLDVVLSNTTEAGLQLDHNDRFDVDPPASFPAKLTRFLYARFEHFRGSSESGMIILPLELIENNGNVLGRLVEETAERWTLGAEFRAWLAEHNIFCNSLVDRIVTGFPSEDELERHSERLPFIDHLLTCTERYHFWAIEGSEAVARRLPFADSSPNVIVTGDIQPYFERKIRILNGGHTLMSPVGFLCGHDTVYDALQDETTGRFVRELLSLEIAPTLPDGVEGVDAFVDEVIERWSNPFLNHSLHDITMQSTMKLRLRAVPTILRHYEIGRGLPRRIAFGFAGCLAFVKQHMVGGIVGEEDAADEKYSVEDDLLRVHARHWDDSGGEIPVFVRGILADSELWGMDVNTLTGFAEEVTRHLQMMIDENPVTALQHLMSQLSTRETA